jgi:putative hydrolase of HD superfamily
VRATPRSWPQATGTVGYLLEMGALKRSKRSGWSIAGIKDPETIAEHSWRTAVIGAVLAMMEGADPAKVALLATFHDTQETRDRHRQPGRRRPPERRRRRRR